MIFNFSDYREYLRHVFTEAGPRSGLKATCSKAIGIKSSFLSIVLAEKMHLSPEQAIKMSSFFNLSEEESHYFLLLVQKSRASTEELAKYYEKQMVQIKKTQGLKHVINVHDEISPQQRALYYSSWVYAAVHVAVSVPELRTRQKLREYFGIPVRRMNEVVEFLLKSGLIQEKKGVLSVPQFSVHLKPGSTEIIQHHITWRMKAAEVLSQSDLLEDLHYSAVVSLAKSDVEIVRGLLSKGLAHAFDKVRTSNEETLYAVNLDFFQLGHQ